MSAADANTRMVDANSWPFVQFQTHNVDEQGNADVGLVLINDGIGPARIEIFELWWDGKPMAWRGALLQACCLTTPVEAEEAKITITSIGIAAPRILRAGEHLDFFTMPKAPKSTELWSKFNVERSKISTRVCYCSVFDQCRVHVSEPGLLRKDPMKMPFFIAAVLAPVFAAMFYWLWRVRAGRMSAQAR